MHRTFRSRDRIGHRPLAENGPIETLAIVTPRQALQKSECGLRIFIGERGDDGLHRLIACRAHGKLLRPGAGRSRIMFRPAADGAGDGPVSRCAGRNRLRVSDGRLRIELCPTPNEQRKEHTFLLGFRKSLNEGEDFSHIFCIHCLGNFAERGVSVAAPRVGKRRFDFGNDIFARGRECRFRGI